MVKPKRVRYKVVQPTVELMPEHPLTVSGNPDLFKRKAFVKANLLHQRQKGKRNAKVAVTFPADTVSVEPVGQRPVMQALGNAIRKGRLPAVGEMGRPELVSRPRYTARGSRVRQTAHIETVEGAVSRNPSAGYQDVSPVYDLKGAAQATARGGIIQAGLAEAGNVASSVVNGLNTEVLHGEIDEDLNIVIDEFRVTVGEILAVGGVAATLYLMYLYKKGAFRWDPFGIGNFGGGKVGDIFG